MEEIAMLPLWIVSVVVLPVLALVFYVVRTSRPVHFRLSATLLKLVTINIEADAPDKPGELPVVPENALNAAPDYNPPG
jgi:hypothetical protein